MKYLRKFATEADVDVDASPNVVLVADSGEVKYNVPMYKNGVYIQHIDGRLYTNDEWSAKGFANEVANGVAVIADECSFVIAKEANPGMAWRNTGATAVDGVMVTTSEATAVTDFNGLANTKIISALYSSGAAYYCANYSFPNGDVGYLPALGELSVAASQISFINEAMALIGDALVSGYYWASTQNADTRAWRMNLLNAEINSQSMMKTAFVRPFAPLNI